MTKTLHCFRTKSLDAIFILALHRKLRIEQHEPHLKPVVNSGAPEGKGK